MEVVWGFLASQPNSVGEPKPVETLSQNGQSSVGKNARHEIPPWKFSSGNHCEKPDGTRHICNPSALRWRRPFSLVSSVPLALTIFLPPLPQGSLMLARKELMETSYLGLSVRGPSLSALCPVVGLLLVPIHCRSIRLLEELSKTLICG